MLRTSPGYGIWDGGVASKDGGEVGGKEDKGESSGESEREEAKE